MFGDFDVDFGKDSCTAFFVKRNGTLGPLKELTLAPNSKLADLFDKASKALDLEATHKLRAFFTSGVECTDVDDIAEDEILVISCGEPFKAAEGRESGSQVVGNFILHEQLGQGGFGSVMKGVHAETGEEAAVKFVPKSSFRQISDLQRVFQEIQAMRNLNHPNVIKIFDVADHPDCVCFIMEFAAGGELKAYVEKRVSLSEEESRVFFKQIGRAVHYIHTRNVIHRDLKLENILLDAQNKCKIVDFGLSDYVSSKERTVTDAGTDAYLAPEVYDGSSGDSDPYKIDVWGLGVILYAMTHGQLPFKRPDAETCAKLDAGGLAFDDEVSAGYRRIVNLMLTVSPEKRSSMNEITIDPWVTKNRFADYEFDHADPQDAVEGEDVEEECSGAIVAEEEAEAEQEVSSSAPLSRRPGVPRPTSDRPPVAGTGPGAPRSRTSPRVGIYEVAQALRRQQQHGPQDPADHASPARDKRERKAAFERGGVAILRKPGLPPGAIIQRRPSPQPPESGAFGGHGGAGGARPSRR